MYNYIIYLIVRSVQVPRDRRAPCFRVLSSSLNNVLDRKNTWQQVGGVLQEALGALENQWSNSVRHSVPREHRVHARGHSTFGDFAG